MMVTYTNQGKETRDAKSAQFFHFRVYYFYNLNVTAMIYALSWGSWEGSYKKSCMLQKEEGKC